MGITKQYLRFVPGPSFGVISSVKGGLLTIRRDGKVSSVASATAESVTVWNLKSGEKVTTLSPTNVNNTKLPEVTALATDPAGSSIAVGYGDGSVRVFGSNAGNEDAVTFNGHKSAVTCLAFDQAGHRLASGARDTTLIVWDVVNECGLYRLKGHKGPVTSLAFLSDPREHVLVSSSKDTLVKFWDLRVQHCFKTLTGHVGEVWDFALIKNDSYLVTGTNDSELRVWKLTFKEGVETDKNLQEAPSMKKLKINEDEDSDSEADDDFDAGVLKVERVGSLLRSGQDKLSHIVVASDPATGADRLMACHGSDNTVELFLVCSDEEVKKRLQKKAKKKRKNKQGIAETTEEIATDEPATLQEEFRRLKVAKASGKVRQMALDCLPAGKDGSGGGLVTVSTANNLIEQFSLPELGSKEAAKNSEPVQVRKLDLSGHRSDVRSVAFSSDNTAILSASHEALKIWNRNTQTCIRTMPSGYGLCGCFVPGDRHVVIGTKKGTLQIFDLASSSMTEEVDAHQKEVWSIHLAPDKRGFVTSSGDKTVKFWQFELVNRTTEDHDSGTSNTEKQLSVIHKRTLKLEEDALCVRLSQDGRLIAVSLLDSTVKVFFVDTLKFFLSLYGHKLPSVGMDISSDSTLLVTGSADKNVKIWGLDFGDCHKSIFAHDDTVTSVRFLPNTHMFFTAGKDGKVKQWDADNSQRILTLDGHHGEVWDLGISPNGKFVVTCGHDKTLRLWEKTQEPLVLEDERETEREAEDETEAANTDSRVVPGSDKTSEAALPSKKTAETERAAERLMEAIQVYQEYMVQLQGVISQRKTPGNADLPDPALPVLMTIYPNVETPYDHMAEVIGRIRSSELEEALLVLPLDNVIGLLEVIEQLLARNLKSEVVCRTFFFLVEIHFGSLSGVGSSSKELLRRVRVLVEQRLRELRDTVGFNLAALRHVENQALEREKVQTFVDATSKFKAKRKKKKQKQKTIQTAILSI